MVSAPLPASLPSWDGAAPAPAADVLRFWFGGRRSDDVDARTVARWHQLGALHVPRWAPTPGADRRADRFAALLESAGTGACDGWRDSPAGRLALVILCDQLPRSIHRGTSRAYASDGLALDATLAGMALGDPRHLTPVEQAFFFTPLVHAEDLALQIQARENYAALCQGAPDRLAALLEVFAASARRHLRIIERFGRFPHRNRILGREDTELERQFMQDPWGFFEEPAGAVREAAP